MRKKKKTQIDRNRLMDRVAAVRCLAETRNDDGIAMAGFMALFHPGHPMTRELVEDAREKGRRQRS